MKLSQEFLIRRVFGLETRLRMKNFRSGELLSKRIQLSPVEVSCFAEASRRVYVCLNGWGVGGPDVYCDGMGWDGSLFGSKSVPKNVLV